VRALKGTVVANQLHRLGGLAPAEVAHLTAEGVGSADPPISAGWRTRVRLEVGADGRAGFHRYHSAELVSDLRCAQLPAGLLDDLPVEGARAGDQLHVVVDDDGARHVVCTGHGRRPRVLEGGYDGVQRAGRRCWRLPVTAFWQAHRDAANTYSAVVSQFCELAPAMTAWDLYGGAGLFAAAMGAAVGSSGAVVSVDTSRGASRAGRAALADLPQVRFVTDSVRRALAAEPGRADVAVLDPPRSGAGRDVIDLIAGVPRILHFGCEAAAFARDVGLYRKHGYTVERLWLYDAFPLTHHVECVAVLTR
jgi:tRNA/tmRNA/rRNA uracil-C5-methylase (TrmA/RlmC/RlmD family)